MKLLLAFLLSCLWLNSTSQEDSTMKSVVQRLSHDSLMGRPAGSEYEMTSLKIIEGYVKKQTQHTLKIQKFDILISQNDPLQCRNGYCFINNHQKNTVLISAHFDHLGLGGNKSKSFVQYQVHNGADDNASGVALITQLIHDLQGKQFQNYNYLFAFYSGHEQGLYGSQAFEQLRLFKRKKIILHINLDMVGRMDHQLKQLKLATNLPPSQCQSDILKIQFAPENFIEQTDAKWSARKKISYIHLTTGIHLDYHKPSDDEQYINYEGMLLIRNYILKNISNWSNMHQN